MTARAHMLASEFEELAQQSPETVWLEFIRGRLEVKPPSDGCHGSILAYLTRTLLLLRPELALYPYASLRTESELRGRYMPDGALAHIGHFAGQSAWTHCAGVLMVVEITPRDLGTDRRDLHEKCAGYAEADIPVCLLVNREAGSITVNSEPRHGTYQQHPTYKYGDTVTLPDPVNVTLATERLKDYTR
ncbi:Uma2 family endonuclease [Streptomyces sp. FIT100]|uniref:Uma2 family endonuclease n=1 Tax=Streptomyces sp. FIT100 TaxID=2837956 RepID=UPI0021CA5933|nr:Uma2 family endonuclease [Streptomyces sp. FIT100]UUN27628.1 Uma2 family endonuclease [Streptomyces sp. FIT100]